MPEQTNGVFRWVVYDGSGLGPDVNMSGGTRYCADSTGDLPLFMITIDSTGAACGSFEQVAGVPVTPPVGVPSVPVAPPMAQMPLITPVPEPATLALLGMGLLMMLWLRGRRV